MVKLPFEVLVLSALATTPLTQASAQPISPDHIQQILRPSDQQRLTPNPNPHQDSSSSYHCYKGDPKSYPPSSQWLPFSELWNLNRETILSANAGDTYLQHYIQSSLEKVSQEYNINPSYLLALLLQESHGDVTTSCTGPEPRCGLLHAYKGTTFNPSDPQASIEKMLREAVKGSALRGPGIHDLLIGKPKFANVEPGEWFAVARAWNSGRVKKGDMDWTPTRKGSEGFVNDVANRLMGWDGTGRGFEGCKEKVGDEGRELGFAGMLADL